MKLRVPGMCSTTVYSSSKQFLSFKRLRMWFDSETFLTIHAEYHRHGLTAMRFLPGNEDFNPSENVWK